MGEVINLRRARKAKARTEAADQAALNRAAHGRSKAEKQAAASETARRERLLDGVRCEE